MKPPGTGESLDLLSEPPDRDRSFVEAAEVP